MAPIDISREAFNPKKHYSSVRMQQGRAFVDDDWNAKERIENEDRCRARVDIVGACGSPDQGFLIRNPRVDDSPPGYLNFDILPGTLYLGGLRLEMELAQEKPSEVYETYRTQKDWLQKELEAPNEIPGGQRYDLVYLEAWQQPVSAVEDDELFEVALGLDGPDTSARIRDMRRVIIEPGVETPDCAREWQKLRQKWQNGFRGELNEENRLVSDATLTVTYNEDENQDDLCKPPVKGGYLGAENHAIRVQLTDYDHVADVGHITWGFDNASPLYRVAVTTVGSGANRTSTVKMLTEPKDETLWPLAEPGC